MAAGRSLIGGASTQVLIFLYGDGANGKSVFMETLAQLCGDYAGRLKPESITGSMEQSGDKASPDFARLQGKRFVAIAELPRGAPMREGLVKTMTGSEPMPDGTSTRAFLTWCRSLSPSCRQPDAGDRGPRQRHLAAPEIREMAGDAGR